MHVASNGTYRSIFDGIGTASRGESLFELPTSFGKYEEVIAYLLDPCGSGKSICSSADEEDVWPMFHQAACETDGSAGGLDRGDRASAPVAPVHDGGIELDLTLLCEHASTPGVEAGILLEDARRRFDRVDGQAPLSEYGAASFQRLAQARESLRFMLWIMVRDSFGTGTAMHHQAPTFFDHGGRP
jgi:hypothetical protein